MTKSAQNSPFLIIRGAKENNLKGLNLEIGHDKLTVVTGLSGSGKSSLAFDTVFAEGQRRYVETFSPYTRQFFDKVKKPDADGFENVRPAIAIQQRTRITSSRSTVGSLTNINDFLKILWANLARPACTVCDIELSAYSASELAFKLLKLKALKPQSSFLIAVRLIRQQSLAREAPKKARGRKSAKSKKIIGEEPAFKDFKDIVDWKSAISELLGLGFSRCISLDSGETKLLEDFEPPDLQALDSIVLVLDRIKAGSAPPQKKRLIDSFEQAFGLAELKLPAGLSADQACLVIEFPENNSKYKPFLQITNNRLQANIRRKKFTVHRFSSVYSCPVGLCTLKPPRAGLFSYNHPLGACPDCKGFGRVLAVDPQLCVPNPSLSVKDKALACWSGPGTRLEYRELLNFCRAQKIPIDLPWHKLSVEHQDLIFNAKTKDYWGVRHWFKWLERKTYKMHVRVFLSRYRKQVTCAACNGARLVPEALSYRIDRKSLGDIWNVPIGDLAAWFIKLRDSYSASAKLPPAVQEVFAALIARLTFLNDLGLSYLTLDRPSRTLSGGETQRVSLASALGSELVSTQFVLDEPSVGLHARDSSRLIDAVRGLAAKGNSVLVVEHDLDFIDSADDIIELGPQAGEHGGEIVYSGARCNWRGIDRRAELEAIDGNRIAAASSTAIEIKHARVRNLDDLSTSIPLGKFVCLSGVSGSGKSTLVQEVLLKAYEQYSYGLPAVAAGAAVQGFEHVASVQAIDQSTLAKSPRANIATYAGIWEYVRELLAMSPDAQSRALGKSAFSFNVDGGRCPACKGAGLIREDMQFLSDVYIACELCLGKRFQPAVLEVKYNDLDVSQILGMTIARAAEFFAQNPKILPQLRVLCELGLDHLTLGHPLSDLSGGEAQRLKLVPILAQAAAGNTRETTGSLLIFDEPTTGLHFHDVQRLIKLFRRLCSLGHSVLCIEHNLSLILASDWIIDLGPEGGSGGGKLVVEGPALELMRQPAALAKSHTLKFLKEYVAGIKSKVTPAISTGAQVSSKNNISGAASKPRALVLKGAREHNLKNISLEVPLAPLTAITGVSGSGKSTIAKDIIYAEGQRRYLDCLSPYARQFIKELKRPEIDDLKNIRPTVCVYQHTFQPSALSTVGTMSEAYNYLRLLYAKVAQQYCPDHPDTRIAQMSVSEMAQAIKDLPAKSMRLLAPIVKMKKGTHRAVFERALASEIHQVRVDGVLLNTSVVSTSGGLEKSKPHTIEFVVGRFNPKQIDLELIEDAVKQALALSAGSLIAQTEQGEFIFSTERTCPHCKRGFFKPDPEDLSFHSNRGRCETCGGSGTASSTGQVCDSCNGTRINALGRNLRIAGKTIHDLALLSPSGLLMQLDKLDFDEHRAEIAAPILRELAPKLETLAAVGLDYLPLTRDCGTLSGGELQRLRLASAIGTSLSGAIYIFDEPSAGLHPSDNALVLKQIRRLQERDNSVLVIEHDPESILACDYIIDVGPGGGKNGGEIVYSGDIKEFVKRHDSVTADCLRRGYNMDNAASTTISTTASNGSLMPRPVLNIDKASCHNIKGLKVSLPLNSLVCVAGVSGAGKSSFLHGIVAATLRNSKAKKSGDVYVWNSAAAELSSSQQIDRIVDVDQKPIGLNSRSTPASYLKVWDLIRALFASTNEARARGWSAGYFSYNSGKGRCPECKGMGMIRLEMNFLADAQMLCETCGGKRYADESLTVRYRGLSISDALGLTFEEAKSVFANHRQIHRSLHLACELGLGYLTLGQSSSSLSGGESQRIKLIAELSTRVKGHTLYILDEPTTGLHRSDVARLVAALRQLVARGDSVCVIEHDADVLTQSDYVIEFGPGPAEDGGKITYKGPPRGLMESTSAWGEWLRKSFVKTKQTTCEQQSFGAVGA